MHYVWVLVVMVTNPVYEQWAHSSWDLRMQPPGPPTKELVTGIYNTQQECLTARQITGQGECQTRVVPDSQP